LWFLKLDVIFCLSWLLLSFPLTARCSDRATYQLSGPLSEPNFTRFHFFVAGSTAVVRGNIPVNYTRREIPFSCSGTNQELGLSVSARFSAGDLAHLPGAVDAAYWHAIGIAVPSDIEICGVARFLQKLRIRDKGEPRN